jgi:hypothetical protein
MLEPGSQSQQHLCVRSQIDEVTKGLKQVGTGDDTMLDQDTWVATLLELPQDISGTLFRLRVCLGNADIHRYHRYSWVPQWHLRGSLAGMHCVPGASRLT